MGDGARACARVGAVPAASLVSPLSLSDLSPLHLRLTHQVGQQGVARLAALEGRPLGGGPGERPPHLRGRVGRGQQNLQGGGQGGDGRRVGQLVAVELTVVGGGGRGGRGRGEEEGRREEEQEKRARAPPPPPRPPSQDAGARCPPLPRQRPVLLSLSPSLRPHRRHVELVVDGALVAGDLGLRKGRTGREGRAVRGLAWLGGGKGAGARARARGVFFFFFAAWGPPRKNDSPPMRRGLRPRPAPRRPPTTRTAWPTGLATQARAEPGPPTTAPPSPAPPPPIVRPSPFGRRGRGPETRRSGRSAGPGGWAPSPG